MKLRWRHWIKMTAVTGAAQVAVQAIGFLAGILVIRLLPVHEYALYTLANTMLGTMAILADGGIAAGVMAEGGKVWSDKRRLGAVLATGMALRRKFALLSLLVAIPALYYLLRKHDASWLMSSMIVLSLLPAFFAALSGKLLEIPILLHQDIRLMQRFQVEANLCRLALLGSTMFILPFAAVAIACVGVSQAWNNRRLRLLSAVYVDLGQETDSNVNHRVLALVRRVMPGAVYYTMSSQLSIWLISILGDSQGIAQLGALSRLTAILGMASSVFGILVVPRYSRLQGDRRSVLTAFLGIQAMFIASAAVILPATWMFPQLLLGLLGEDYVGLNRELLLIMASSLAGVFSGAVYAVNASRGHVWPPLLLYPLVFLIQIGLLMVLPVGTVQGVAIFSLMTSLAALVLHSGFGVFRIQNEAQVSSNT